MKYYKNWYSKKKNYIDDDNNNNPYNNIHIKNALHQSILK